MIKPDLNPILFDYSVWQRITSYGDVGINLPMAIALAVWLLFAKNWRAALAWWLYFCGVMGIVVASKLAFMGWGIGIQVWDFTGFSGHSMRACALFPVAFYMLPPDNKPQWRNCAAVLGVIFGGFVSWSRIVVGAHSISEIVLGAMLGFLTVALFLQYLSKFSQPKVPIWLMAATFAAFAFIPHKNSAPTQSWLIAVAMKISGHDRPFERYCWCYSPYPWQMWPPKPIYPISTPKAAEADLFYTKP